MSMSVQAENLTQWPARCIVCKYEHCRDVWAKSAKKAVKHRRKHHAWLHDIKVRDGQASA